MQEANLLKIPYADYERYMSLHEEIMKPLGGLRKIMTADELEYKLIPRAFLKIGKFVEEILAKNKIKHA